MTQTTLRPQPTRVTVPADEALYARAITGHTELRLPAGTQVDVGDIVHLVEHGSGRCCYRLVTRKGGQRAPGGLVAVTVLPGTGQCEGRHR